MFKAPIPGQSLTTTPKNAPYERPPKVAEPDKALALHLERLSDEKRLDSAMQMLERGVDIQTLTQGILRGAVANGIHSVDVSLIIAPVIHEYLKTTADAIGIEYKEGKDFEEADDDDIQRKSGQQLAVGKIINGKDMPKMEEEVEAPMPEEQPQERPSRGLMARR